MKESIRDQCFKIKDHTAIVTGASSGLGVSFAEALADEGANIVIAARRYERLVKVAEELSRKYDVKVIPVKTDVSSEDEVVNMVRTATEQFGS